MSPNAEQAEVLVTVKSYPMPSTTYQETVCVAGIRIDREPYEWIRLYPIRFRDLPYALQFKKYQIISLPVSKTQSDTRPETPRPHEDSIKIGDSITTKGNWGDRSQFVEPLISASMCDIFRQNKDTRKSLGAFRPAEVFCVDTTTSTAQWSEKQANILNEIQLWSQQKTPLEKIPINFKLHYRCEEKSCKSHKQTIVDWEIGQLYRNIRSQLGPSAAIDAVKEKVVEKIDSICSAQNDLVVYTGNQHLHERGFLVLGFYYPKKLK